MSWQCLGCGKEVDSKDVTYYETHDKRAGGCGSPVFWEETGQVETIRGSERNCPCTPERLFVREALVKVVGQIRAGIITTQCMCGLVYLYDLSTGERQLQTRH